MYVRGIEDLIFIEGSFIYKSEMFPLGSTGIKDLITNIYRIMIV